MPDDKPRRRLCDIRWGDWQELDVLDRRARLTEAIRAAAQVRITVGPVVKTLKLTKRNARYWIEDDGVVEYMATPAATGRVLLLSM